MQNSMTETKPEPRITRNLTNTKSRTRCFGRVRFSCPTNFQSKAKVRRLVSLV